MNLRPYQQESIKRILAAFAQHRRLVFVAPTGSGKTRTCAELVARVVRSKKRGLWLAHRAELVDQSADTLTALGLTVGGMCATGSTPPNPFASVQVATVQTLLARGHRPPADFIVADEAHHFASSAEEFAAVLNSYEQGLILGATATPERGDGCGLRACFDGIVVGPTVQELMDLGHLVPCEVRRPNTPLAAGKIAQNPVDAYCENARGRSAIVFCRSVPLAEQYADEFRMRGIESRCLTAETPWAERRMYIDAFRRGKIQVLTNVFVLTEGFDAPEMSCVIVARGCSSPGMWLQMVGRALRPASGKRDALILDLRGVSHDHGLPEDERDYSLDGKGIRLSDPNSYCPVCGMLPGQCVCSYEREDTTNKPDKVTGDPLVKYARKRGEDEEQKIRTLARWISTARENNYKLGWVQHRFNVVYGVWPSPGMMRAASEVSHGIGNTAKRAADAERADSERAGDGSDTGT